MEIMKLVEDSFHQFQWNENLIHVKSFLFLQCTKIFDTARHCFMRLKEVQLYNKSHTLRIISVCILFAFSVLYKQKVEYYF